MHALREKRPLAEKQRGTVVLGLTGRAMDLRSFAWRKLRRARLRI
jgi:hypothetical protein